jgi:hypothetical protein
MVGIRTLAGLMKTREVGMRVARLIVALIAWAGVAGAQPWIPNECSVRHEKKWSEFARAMREAKPGAQIYAPKPFPKDEPEVIEDFKYGYRQMLKGMSDGEMLQEEWPLYMALEKNTLSFRLLRVENWAPDRCRPDRQRDFSYLLYLTDTASGQEVGRAFLNQNGLLAGWAIAPSGTELNGPEAALYRESGAPQLTEALAQVVARFGIKGARAQYVTSWGRPECPLVSPCVAFQAGGKSYLYRGGDLVEISSASRSFNRADMEATRTRHLEIAGSIDPTKEWLVSIADERWVLASRVMPRQ